MAYHQNVYCMCWLYQLNTVWKHVCSTKRIKGQYPAAVYLEYQLTIQGELYDLFALHRLLRHSYSIQDEEHRTSLRHSPL